MLASMDEIKPLTIKELDPFPLPKYLESLPISVIEQFVQLHNLVKGYIEQLPAHQKFNDKLIETLNWQISTLNEISNVLKTYSITGAQIKEQIAKLNTIYGEFINLETYQYQLLSSNFNPEFLKKKYSRLVTENDLESRELISKFRLENSGDFENSFNDFIKGFRSSRKLYHLRKEKLNRWNEERVSGFM